MEFRGDDLRQLAYNVSTGRVIRKGIYPYRNGAGWGDAVELRCPNCGSTELKKVSLAYQEGLSGLNVRTRMRGVVIGSEGPDLVVGRATTKGTQQTNVSKVLTPPKKWSYRKLVGWSVLVFLSVAWIVFYVNTITKNSSSVPSVPLAVYSLFSAGVFIVLFLICWRHNHSTYPGQCARWNRSFICERCGGVSEHDVPGLPLS